MSKFWRKRKNGARKTRVATSFVILLSQGEELRRTLQAQVENLKQCHQLTRTCSVPTLACRILKSIGSSEYLAEFLKTYLKTGQFLVTAVPRINIGGLLSCLVLLSSSVPELTRHELRRGLHVNPWGGVLQKRGTALYSCCGRVRALVMSAVSLSCQILVMFEAHWPMKAFPSSTC